MGLNLATGSALAASLVLMASACSDDATAQDPAETTSPSVESSPSAEPETAPPAEMVDFGDEPAVRSSYKRAALRAVDDDLITMVPSVLPDGWSTTGGGYRGDPQWWRMEFVAPSGDVVLDQLPGSAEDALADNGDLSAQDDVDLSDWGTGAWSAWDHQGSAVLAYDLKGSTVVLQGADLETVRALAQSLLPAEDAVTAGD